jgi:hypothetical protein
LIVHRSSLIAHRSSDRHEQSRGLLTHHARAVNPATGQFSGALSHVQAAKVREIVTTAGQPFVYVSLPTAAHAMHQADPARFAQVLTTWARTLPA